VAITSPFFCRAAASWSCSQPAGRAVFLCSILHLMRCASTPSPVASGYRRRFHPHGGLVRKGERSSVTWVRSGGGELLGSMAEGTYSIGQRLMRGGVGLRKIKDAGW
jgi:hypothetical protein